MIASRVVSSTSFAPAVPAGDCPRGTLVRFQYLSVDHIGIIVRYGQSLVNLLSLTDGVTWSALAPGRGLMVTPLARGEQVILEAV